MSANDERYMAEINRLEGERDFFRRNLAELKAELAEERASYKITCEKLQFTLAAAKQRITTLEQALEANICPECQQIDEEDEWGS